MVTCTRDGHPFKRDFFLDLVQRDLSQNGDWVHGERAVFSTVRAVTINLSHNVLLVLKNATVKYFHLIGIERELGIQRCFEKQCRNRWKRRDWFAHWIIYHSRSALCRAPASRRGRQK